jgi:hypothetical protein
MTETETLAITVTEEQERTISAGHSALAEEAAALVIDDSDSLARGWAIVNRVGELVKIVKHDFAASKQAAHTAWKTIVAQEAGWLKQLEGPDAVVRGKIVAYKQEEERQLRAAEEIARVEAQRRADEANRLAREKAEREAEERQLEQAAAAEAAGDKETAQAILEQSVEAAPVQEVAAVVIPTMVLPKVAGEGGMIERWHFEVADEALVPREFLMVDEKKIGRYVATMKGGAKVAGVRIWSEKDVRRVGKRFGSESRRVDAAERPAADRGPWEAE